MLGRHEPPEPLRLQHQSRGSLTVPVGKVLGHYKVGKHFDIVIEDVSFRYQRKQAQIDAEAALDGIYVIRTSVKTEIASPETSRASLQKPLHGRVRFS